MNQASVKSLVVPVLPAIGRPAAGPVRGAALGDAAQQRRRMKAVSARSASVARGSVSSITLPSRSVMRSIRNGFMRSPWFAKVANAAVISDERRLAAPRAIGR